MILLLFNNLGVLLNVQITFYDQTGVNPVAPGTFVVITNYAGNIVAVGYIGVGGIFNAQLYSHNNYTATFVGEQAPIFPVTFQAPAAP